MGQRLYWHNITQNKFNENDLGDTVENADKGDDIRFSARGNAIVISLLDLSDGDEIWTEFEDYKKEFLEYYKEIHGEEFY